MSSPSSLGSASGDSAVSTCSARLFRLTTPFAASVPMAWPTCAMNSLRQHANGSHTAICSMVMRAHHYHSMLWLLPVPAEYKRNSPEWRRMAHL